MKQVSGNLFRGVRPKTFNELIEDGFAVVIDLESGFYDLLHNDLYEQQAMQAKNVIQYHIPCSDFTPPRRDSVLQFLSDVNGGLKTYVHCLTGVDRTGFMCAVYRMQVCGWTFKQAKAEYIKEGQHFWYRWWIPFLKQYEIKQMAKKIYKLGKLPARHDERTLQFADYLIAPSFPPSRKWSDKVTKLGMMANNEIGDCTFATSGHAVQVWTANNGNQVIIDDCSVIKGYSDVSGYDPKTGLNDNGCVELDVLNYLRKTGIGGHIIYAYTQINTRRVDLIKAAINIFGCARLCAAMPISVQQQTIWKDPKGKLSGNDRPGSWGGHSFLGVDYDETYVYIISWGKIIKVEWGWFTTYGDEAYAVLSMDWVNNNLAPNNINLDQLQKDLLSI